MQSQTFSTHFRLNRVPACLGPTPEILLPGHFPAFVIVLAIKAWIRYFGCLFFDSGMFLCPLMGIYMAGVFPANPLTKASSS